MASTVLPNGIIIPEKYSRDWYADLYHNWQELDNLLGGGTPKDGTLTIQKNGTAVGTFSANQATDETVNIEVPDVNNGTLTIQQNGTTVDTFTANSSSDKTVNIQCVDLSSNQTVGGNKEFTGTTTAHDVIPSATDTYNFGSPSYQWNNAYIKSLTINGVACGDILTHNVSEFANDADVVHIKGSDNIIDSKTFISLYTQSSGPSLWMKNTSFTMGTAPTTNRYSGLWIQDNNGTDTAYIVHQANKNNSQNLKFSVSNTDGSNTYQNALTFQGRLDGTFNFYSDNPASLGTSTNKWKSFNGINPGALSLWGNNIINLDTTSFDVTATTIGTFASTVDGWANLVIGQKNKPFGIWLIGGTVRVSFYSVKNNDDYFVFALIPVRANVNMTIYCTASDIDSTRNISWLRVSPCQGNV